MIEGVGHHRFDDRDLIGDFGQAGQQFGKLGAAFSLLGEFELRAQQSRLGLMKAAR